MYRVVQGWYRGSRRSECDSGDERQGPGLDVSRNNNSAGHKYKTLWPVVAQSHLVSVSHATSIWGRDDREGIQAMNRIHEHS